MSLFRKFPVATVLAILGALATGEQVAEEDGLIHGTWAGWAKLVLLVLLIVLGKAAHTASTPVADPKAQDGTPLVPDPGVQRTGPVL